MKPHLLFVCLTLALVFASQRPFKQAPPKVPDEKYLVVPLVFPDDHARKVFSLLCLFCSEGLPDEVADYLHEFLGLGVDVTREMREVVRAAARKNDSAWEVLLEVDDAFAALEGATPQVPK